jgi:hypothetical protein
MIDLDALIANAKQRKTRGSIEQRTSGELAFRIVPDPQPHSPVQVRVEIYLPDKRQWHLLQEFACPWLAEQMLPHIIELGDPRKMIGYKAANTRKFRQVVARYVACPVYPCEASKGSPCSRPSGHAGGTFVWHERRREAFDVWLKKHHLPEGWPNIESSKIDLHALMQAARNTHQGSKAQHAVRPSGHAIASRWKHL